MFVRANRGGFPKREVNVAARTKLDERWTPLGAYKFEVSTLIVRTYLKDCLPELDGFRLQQRQGL